ncbi:hypothetical protein [Virgibacillus kimchii]
MSKSGHTLATTAEQEGLSLIVITLNSNMKNEAYDDTINLLNYGFENYTTSYIEEGTEFTLDNAEYLIPKTIAYVEPLNDDKIKKRVDEDGTLNIVNQDDVVVGSYMLEKNNNENKTANAANPDINSQASNEVKTEKASDYNYIYAVLGVILAAIIIFGIIYRQTRKM